MRDAFALSFAAAFVFSPFLGSAPGGGTPGPLLVIGVFLALFQLRFMLCAPFFRKGPEMKKAPELIPRQHPHIEYMGILTPMLYVWSAASIASEECRLAL